VEIQKDQVRLEFSEGLLHRFRIGYAKDLVSDAVENGLKELDIGRFVIDDQDSTGH
jgi:hypothetical protein